MKLIKSLKQFLLKHRYLVLAGFIAVVVLVFAPIAYDFISTSSHRYDIEKVSIEKVPYHKVGIVFGAGILPNDQPTEYLKYRIQTAIMLFKAHKINILLMSGDNSVTTHNEPLVMKNYAIEHGVPAKAIVVDDAGFDTYDTCYRARHIFGITSATLISQGYHIPRAMVTCNGVGVKNIGVISIHPTRDYTISYLVREVFSSDKMVLDLIFQPKPNVLGNPLPLNSSN